MNTTRKLIYFAWAAIMMLVIAACKKPFNPTLSSSATGYLAVDGAIISGDSTFITLSRTTGLNDTTQQKAELKAQLSVEDDQGTLYAFTEKGKGVYTTGINNYSTARKYRLDIKTSNGKVYQSDFVQMKVTPPIDSIYFKQNSDATVLFYADTHDPTNNTRYYRWDYKETYSIVPFYQAFYEYKNAQIVQIISGSADDLSVCYQTDNSNQVFIGSSSKLAQDVIRQQLLGGLAASSIKIAKIYVMQLRQYALTEDGYNYYQNLQTNTEQLGSIFDAQPSTLLGNIHCIITPTEPVYGFVSVSTVTQKQFNLHSPQIPLRANDLYTQAYFDALHIAYVGPIITPGYSPPPRVDQCTFSVADAYVTWTMPVAPAATFNTRASKTLSRGDTLLINAIYSPQDATGFYALTAYYYAPKQCVDCRIKSGGSNIKPSYFPAF